MNLMKPHSRTVIISPVTPTIFEQLHLKYNKTLACPCSNGTVPYKNFVSNTIKYHPVCSSTFVGQKWIEALYFPDASRYGVTDFRTTASSQVRQYLFLKKPYSSTKLVEMENIILRIRKMIYYSFLREDLFSSF
jgi:hypothetical protein